MTNRLLHTPEGVRDIYNAECAKKRILQELLDQEIRSFGYHPIQTPSFEFFDIFSRQIGTTPSNELFKFFDRDGNTLVLRPDITPSVARAAAKYYPDENIPLRLCYLGNTFINHTSHQGRLKETTQIGAEMIGADDAAADAEIIALTIASFLKAGLTEFQITIGHTGFFNALCEAAGLDGESEAQVRSLIASKNYYAAQDILQQTDCPQNVLDIFSDFSVLNGTGQMLGHTRAAVSGIPEARRAIERLTDLYDLLKIYGYERYVSFDLSFLSRYGYYTGIIFEGYTYGSGEAIAKGGRYDELLSHFGKQAPAVGTVLLVDTIMTAMSRQEISLPVPEEAIMILYRRPQTAQAIRQAAALREKGRTVSTLCMGETQTAADFAASLKRFHYDQLIDLTLSGGQEQDCKR